MKFWFPLVAAASACLGQSPASLTWEGEVDGVVILRARENRLEVERKSGSPVQRQRFRFSDRLPDYRTQVRLEVIEGRGGAWISEQPRLENNYTVSVTIEDLQDGAAFYSLALRWDDGKPGQPSGGAVSWSGRASGEAVIACRRGECAAEIRSGRVDRARSRFTAPLPEQPIMVRLGGLKGRGEIKLIEEPTRENGYTARVLINDRPEGSDNYAFTLDWTTVR